MQVEKTFSAISSRTTHHEGCDVGVRISNTTLHQQSSLHVKICKQSKSQKVAVRQLYLRSLFLTNIQTGSVNYWMQDLVQADCFLCCTDLNTALWVVLFVICVHHLLCFIQFSLCNLRTSVNKAHSLCV